MYPTGALVHQQRGADLGGTRNGGRFTRLQPRDQSGRRGTPEQEPACNCQLDALGIDVVPSRQTLVNHDIRHLDFAEQLAKYSEEIESTEGNQRARVAYDDARLPLTVCQLRSRRKQARAPTLQA